MGVREVITKHGKVYRVECQIQGKRYSQNFTRRCDADAFMLGLESLRPNYEDPNNKKEPLLLGRAWKIFVDQCEEKGLLEETIKSYYKTAEKFQDILDENILEIPIDKIVKIYEGIRNEHTNNSLSRSKFKRIITHLRFVFNTAKDLGYARKDIGELWSRMKAVLKENRVEQKRSTAYSEEEVKKLLSTPSRGPYWVLPLIEILIITAKRLGEILALTFDKVDFENRKIHICSMVGHGHFSNHLKSFGKPHDIQMDDRLYELFCFLKKKANNQNGDWVFMSAQKYYLSDFLPEDKCPYKLRPIVQSAATRYIREHMAEAGVPLKQVHDLRRTGAVLTFLKYGGDSIAKAIVQRMLNHDEIGTTEEYIGISHKTLDERINGETASKILSSQRMDVAPKKIDEEIEILKREKEILELRRKRDELKKKTS